MAKHESFGGRVIFYTRPTNLRATLDYTNLTKIAADIAHDGKEAEGLLADTLYCISITEQLEFCFQGNETALLTDFRAMWEQLRPYSAESVTRALDWMLNGAMSILDEWKKAATKGDALWIDPVDAPIEKLDAALQEAAADPENPLASSAPKGSKRTSPS